MITKTTWQAVHEELTAEDRRRLGDPPTGDEVLAYLNDELPEAEAERVRALLVAYPELARTLTHPFPAEGEGEVFSDAELGERFARLGGRAEPPRGRVLSFRAVSSIVAVAATLVLVFGALLWDARRDLARPHLAVAGVEVLPDGRRGPRDSAVAVGAPDQALVLMVSIADQPEFPAYRVDIVDAAGKRRWSSSATARPVDEAFTIVLPRGLPAGRYQIVVTGVDGREQQLATHSFRVPAR